MQDFAYKYKKPIIVGSVLALVLIVAVSIYFIVMDKINSATVNIVVAPTIAEVKIGDGVYKSMETYKIRPGEYTVEVSAEGFETKTGNLVAIEGESVDIQMFLEPTEENAGWYENHPEDALILGEVKNHYTIQAIQELNEKNPILGQLPIEIDYYTSNYANRVRYTIGYRLNEDNSDFIIVVTDYTGGNYEDALEKLRVRGYNPEDFVIQYEDMTSDSEWGHAG